MENLKTWDIKKFASDLYAYRNMDLKIGRKEFSEKFQVSQHILNHIENAQTIPNLNDAYKLCSLMGTNLNDYFK